MKIERDDILHGLSPQARPVHGSRKDPGEQAPEVAKEGDRLELSERGRALISAKEALAVVPPVRSDKVASLKQQIKDGTYHVPGEKVAEKLLAEGLFA